ncbi:cell surface A33 antigen [Mus caroli]|uniref:Cell surface A33 antigen n=1 Tax=Mus caroli TaxID=10089 RepID=A0A6P7QXY3_MUSCR|nr:cell surface A33 antigen [Mus caroli]
MLGKAGSVVWMLCAIWVAADALTVETTQDILRAARGRSVTLPCTYSTYVPDREGFIQWDKLLRSQTERVVTWNFVTKKYIYGNRYENRVRVSKDAELSNASITIDQLTMDDNGTYECSLSLMSDQDVTAKSRVRLLVLEDFKQMARNGVNLKPDSAGPPTKLRPVHQGPPTFKDNQINPKS